MKKILLLFAVAFFLVSTSAFAGTCPAVLYSPAGCDVLITIDSSGGASISYPNGITTTYDGSDDVLIGLQNNSAVTINSLVFSGSGNGGGAFDFDGDGACLYYANCNHPAGTTWSWYGDNGYYDQGSGVFFTNVNAGGTSGTINFAGGVAPGGFAWWSMESSANTGGFTVPEPGMLSLLGLGLFSLLGLRKKV